MGPWCPATVKVNGSKAGGIARSLAEAAEVLHARIAPARAAPAGAAQRLPRASAHQ
jgi:hypothetical protein